MIVLRCDSLHSVSVVIPLLRIDNSVFLVPFSHVLVLSVRVSATIERLLSNSGWSTPCAYKKQRILHFYSKGCKAQTIQKFLAAENLVCSYDGITKFIKVFECTTSICRQPGSGRPSKVTCEVKDVVEQQMVREA